MNKLKNLPEKWAIKRDSSNYTVVNEWFNANFPEDGEYFGDWCFMHSENVRAVKKTGQKPKGRITRLPDFTLINTSQFMKWVYMPWKQCQQIKLPDGWIPCSERLPLINTDSFYSNDYPIMLKDGNWYKAVYSCLSKEWIDREGRNYKNVIAWYDLPNINKK